MTITAEKILDEIQARIDELNRRKEWAEKQRLWEFVIGYEQAIFELERLKVRIKNEEVD